MIRRPRLSFADRYCNPVTAFQRVAWWPGKSSEAGALLSLVFVMLKVQRTNTSKSILIRKGFLIKAFEKAREFHFQCRVIKEA